MSRGAKLVPTNGKPSFFSASIIFRFFPSRGEKKKIAAFCATRLEVVLQGISVEIFAQKMEDLAHLSSTLTKQNLAKKKN